MLGILYFPTEAVTRGVSQNFAKFTGKHLYQSLFFNKAEKETLAQVFFCEFGKILMNMFFAEHLWATASVPNIQI